MRAERREKWGRLIREQLSSGKSQSAFCRDKRITLSSFQYHKSQGAHLEAEAEFLSLSDISENKGASPSGSIEIFVRQDLKVALPLNISAERLAEVVKCLS